VRRQSISKVASAGRSAQEPVKTELGPGAGLGGARCQADERYVWWVVTAFVLMDAEPARVAELAEEVAAIEGVAEAYSVAGHADVVAIIRVRQIEELAQVVTGRLAGLRGVTDTRTLVAFQSYSRKDLDEMWELGAEG
jgi:DNA-binding Lrp family transcriptional regulator